MATRPPPSCSTRCASSLGPMPTPSLTCQRARTAPSTTTSSDQRTTTPVTSCRVAASRWAASRTTARLAHPTGTLLTPWRLGLRERPLGKFGRTCPQCLGCTSRLFGLAWPCFCLLSRCQLTPPPHLLRRPKFRSEVRGADPTLVVVTSGYWDISAWWRYVGNFSRQFQVGPSEMVDYVRAVAEMIRAVRVAFPNRFVSHGDVRSKPTCDWLTLIVLPLRAVASCGARCIRASSTASRMA